MASQQRWQAAIYAMASALVVAAVLLAARPPDYEATVLVALASPQESAAAIDAAARTAIDVIRSSKLLEKVARTERLGTDPEFSGRGGISIAAAAEIETVANELSKRIRIRRTNEAAINVSVRSSDPEKAKHIAGAILGAYIDHTVAPDVSAIPNEIRADSEAAALSAEKVKKDPLEPALLPSLDSLRRAQVRTARNKDAYEFLKSLSARSRPSTLEKTGSATILRLLPVLERSELRLTAARRALLPAHPDYIQAVDGRRRVRAEIDNELSRLTVSARGRYFRSRTIEGELAGEQRSVKLQTSTASRQSQPKRDLPLPRNSPTPAGGLQDFPRVLVGAADASTHRVRPQLLPIVLGALLAAMATGLASALFWNRTLARSQGGTRIIGQTIGRREPAVGPVNSLVNENAAVAKVEVMSRLPATPRLAFPADYISAVDEASSCPRGYRAAIDDILQRLTQDRRKGSPLVVMVASVDADADASGIALALAYRSAALRQKTLLVDAAVADPRLGIHFAGKLRQSRPCVLDSEDHLSDIVLRDRRTELSLLPLALAELFRLTPGQQMRLETGLRRLAQRYEFVILDAGMAGGSIHAAFLEKTTDWFLIVRSDGHTGLTQIEEIARRANGKTRVSVIEAPLV